MTTFLHRLSALGVLLALSACDLLTGPDTTPARIEVSPAVLAFDAIGDQTSIAADVFNKDGDLLSNISLTWSSSTPAVVGISQSGNATSAGNGTANIAVSAGDVTKLVPVSVNQTPQTIELVSGASQIGTVDTFLPIEIRVRVLDRLGMPVENVSLLFSVSSGGGSVNSATTNTDGTGSAGTQWKLGTVAGAAQTLMVRTAASATPTLSISATAQAGPPATILAESGSGQSGVVGSTLATDFVARVIDAFGNPVPGVTVAFGATQGGGSPIPTTQATDPSGRSSTRLALGTVAGTNIVSATVQGIAPVTFSATALSGPPALLRILAGNGQAATTGATLPIALSVRVEDAFGNGVPLAQLSFTPGAGMGSANPPAAFSEQNGSSSTTWTLGPSTGVQTLTVSLSGGGVAPVVFSATASLGGGGGGGGGASYQIQFNFVNPVSAAIQDVFQNAAARWSQIITGDLPDVSGTVSAGSGCENPSPVSGPFDDLYIFVYIVPIDGVGTVLGSAGPCFIRTGSNLPVIGLMRLDIADVNDLLGDGLLDEVVLHEIGHVLGIGTIWNTLGLLNNPSPTSGVGLDTHFSGAGAISAYNAAGGVGYTGGAKVPVENSMGGAGTRNSHWRVAAFSNQELMTGFISTVSSPLSRITAASLADLGYTVDLGAADPYSLPPGGSTTPPAADERLRLFDDVHRGVIEVVSLDGETLETIDPEAP